MGIFWLVFLIVGLIIGLWIASLCSPTVEWLLGFIWQDPTRKNRTKVMKRVKELCVDGGVPDQTSILIAAQELNLTEEYVRDALDGMSPQVMKALAKGDSLSAFLRATIKLSNKIKGKGGS